MLYTIVRKIERGRWTKPKKLASSINQEGSTTTQPSIAWDPIKKRDLLFFSSNRPGGKGGNDLYLTWEKPNGKFVEPINLEKVNTEGNEITAILSCSISNFVF